MCFVSAAGSSCRSCSPSSEQTCSCRWSAARAEWIDGLQDTLDRWTVHAMCTAGALSAGVGRGAPWKLRKQAPSAVRHTCRKRSKEPLASMEPSGLKARLYTGWLCSRRQATQAPVSPFHSLRAGRVSASLLPAPSGLQLLAWACPRQGASAAQAGCLAAHCSLPCSSLPVKRAVGRPGPARTASMLAR